MTRKVMRPWQNSDRHFWRGKGLEQLTAHHAAKKAQLDLSRAHPEGGKSPRPVLTLNYQKEAKK